MQKALALALLLVLGACTTRGRSGEAPRDLEASLELDPVELRRRGAPEALVARLRADVFAYFRMLAEPYELRVCAAFAELLPSLPVTAVEGDAHLEQFAITSSSYGLDDFDRAGFGPAVVDLVRYAASLHLACAGAKLRCDGDAAVQLLLDTYRGGLVEAPRAREPGVTVRLRAQAVPSRSAWLAHLQRALFPLAPEVDRQTRAVWSAYVKQSTRGDREAAAAKAIVSLGGIRSGIGSATAQRALLRIAGPTSSADDDLIVELRRGVASKPRSCVWRGPPNESIALLAMSMVRREMPAIHGFVLGDSPAWLQSWDPSYVELSLEDLTSQPELDELIVDAAGQLAGHTWSWYPEPMRTYQRAAQLEAFDRVRARVAATAKELADETRAAWRRFTLR